MERTLDRVLATKYTRRKFLGRVVAIAGAAITSGERAYAHTLSPPIQPEDQPEPEKPWTFIAKITSYCLWGLTRAETPVRDGVVATDPRVIPLGSTLDIESLGEDFIAEDTGTAVIGRHVDVWNSDCG